MPTLHIPNAYLLYQTEPSNISSVELLPIQLYCKRFMWLVEPGDIIILPLSPPKYFAEYIARLKKISWDDIKVIGWYSFASNLTAALSNQHLITFLEKFVQPHWDLQTCFYNHAIQKLIQVLKLNTYNKLVTNRKLDKIDSKIWFRKFAKKNNLPIPPGQICNSRDMLTQAIKKYIDITGQLMIKKPHGASGKGNLGLSRNIGHSFQGAANIMTWSAQNNFNDDIQNNLIVDQVWQGMRDSLNHQLIVEVYYPHQNVFTMQTLVTSNYLKHFPCTKIRMADTWYGVQLSDQLLDSPSTELLQKNVKKLAYHLAKNGYRGYFCCDAIQRLNGELLFTEANMRPGAETPAYYIAQYLLGSDYIQNRTLITRRNLPIQSWQQLMRLIVGNRAFYLYKKIMVVVIGFCETLKLAECLFIGPNRSSALNTNDPEDLVDLEQIEKYLWENL